MTLQTTLLMKKDRRADRTRYRLKKVSQGRLRLSVFRSNQNIAAQIIDDVKGVTLVAASSLEKEFRAKHKSGANKEAAKVIGQMIAERAKKKGIETVVFDRGSHLYHGRLKELAEAARAGGLSF
jgi:large subunit ribosomal protein L18